MIPAWVGFIVLSWLAADFIAGVFHWLEERYFEADWPIIGKYIATPNQEHHAQPLAFLEGSYLYRNWTTIVPALLALVGCLMVPALNDAWLTCVFLTQANEVHAWSHQQGKVSTAIHVLQLTGIVQSPRHHAEHHRSPHDIRYCVMSNWLNPWLDYFRLWSVAEYALAKFRIKVRVSA